MHAQRQFPTTFNNQALVSHLQLTWDEIDIAGLILRPSPALPFNVNAGEGRGRAGPGGGGLYKNSGRLTYG